MRANEIITEKWSQKYKKSINCAHPKGFSQRAHCAGKKKHNESVEMEHVCPDCGRCETHGDPTRDTIDEACWKGYHKEGMKKMFGKTYPNCVKNEAVAEGSEAFRNKVRSALWYEWQQDPNYRDEDGKPYEQTPEQMDQDDYDMFEEAVDEIVQYANEMGIANAAMAVAKYNMLISDVVQRDLGGSKGLAEQSTGLSLEARAELIEEFDQIESIIEGLAEHNGVDAEVIWEDLESLSDDELYVFATTTTIMENTVQIPHKGKMVSGKVVRKDPVSGEYIVDVGEYGSVRVPAHKVKHDVEEDWQKVNKKDRTAGMSPKAVKAYRREHPGSKLQTAVTTKPSKLKKGSKASKRRSSYCSRSKGQMKMHNISCAKTPDKAICKARRRWNCE